MIGEATALMPLIQRALHEGVRQVQAAGSPLHPLLFVDGDRVFFLYREGDEDPMSLALQAIQSQATDARRCALVVDSRITGEDGRRWDAIVVMACERGRERGEVWAQRYAPKRLFRSFRIEGEAEQIGESRDFISHALTA